MKRLKPYHCSMPSDISRVGDAVENIMQYFQQNHSPIHECCLFELRVITNELVLNAVKHGNKQDDKKRVTIAADLVGKDYTFLTVSDEGEGYDYHELMQQGRPELTCDDVCNLKETGRGLMIVKNISDRIRFNEKGNRVYVLKRIFPPG